MILLQRFDDFWLTVFVLLGLGGAILTRVGFAFGRWGMEPAGASSVQLPTASTPAQSR